MHKNTAQLIKWIAGTAIAMSAVAITIMTFVLNNAVPKASAPAPAPVYIVVPTIAPLPPPPVGPPGKGNHP